MFYLLLALPFCKRSVLTNLLWIRARCILQPFRSTFLTYTLNTRRRISYDSRSLTLLSWMIPPFYWDTVYNLKYTFPIAISFTDDVTCYENRLFLICRLSSDNCDKSQFIIQSFKPIWRFLDMFSEVDYSVGHILGTTNLLSHQILTNVRQSPSNQCVFVEIFLKNWADSVMSISRTSSR